ncbi:hypothetical protein AL052_25475 [Pseudomonas amygdali pv. eriobotryae]|nr:hypothetical protein AL052_25475 [Pseudomonas amygdali pv. eriobotryae]
MLLNINSDKSLKTLILHHNTIQILSPLWCLTSRQSQKITTTLAPTKICLSQLRQETKENMKLILVFLELRIKIS